LTAAAASYQHIVDRDPNNLEAIRALGNVAFDQHEPDKSVGYYERYMKDVHTTFSEGRLGLAACGYMHNMRDTDSLLFDAAFRTLLAQYPLFTGGDTDEFATFLTGRLSGGDGVALRCRALHHRGSLRRGGRLRRSIGGPQPAGGSLIPQPPSTATTCPVTMRASRLSRWRATSVTAPASIGPSASGCLART
jgi:hypothetical protein